MEIDRNKVLPFLWTITIIFYFLRSVLEPLKYLFLVSFGLLIVYFSLYLLSNFNKSTIAKYISLTKEFQVLGLFLLLGIIFSSQLEVLPIKSFVNFIGITVIFLIYFEFRNHIQVKKLLKAWIILILIIGLIGLTKWLNFVLGFQFGLFSIFYEYGTSLVSEYNFYACYFIISLVVYVYGIKKEIIQNKVIVNLALIFLLFLNVMLSGSRRGIIILIVLVLVSLGLLIANWKHRRKALYKNILCFNLVMFAFLLLSVIIIPFRSSLIQEKTTKRRITTTIYRYSTIFLPNINYSILYDKLWPRSAIYEYDKTDWAKYSTLNNSVAGGIINKNKDIENEYWLPFEINKQTGNLFYNSNFNSGQIFWDYYATDSIRHDLISTEYGNALRVSRLDGQGSWPLAYVGRDIFYHSGVSYTFKFKFRVVKGIGVPFKIGWWINEGEGYKNSLPYKTRKLGKGWYEYTASHKFSTDQHHLRTFMNSQQANTVIDFTDIELYSDDSIVRPAFFDQITDDDKINLLYNSNFEHGLKFWSKSSPDLIQHDLIDSQFGKALRVSRKEGTGYWQLVYQGRDLFYHKGVTYNFRFKFRVVEGGEAPFNIGWWLPEENKNPFNLKKDIIPLREGWFGCTTSYTFKKNYYGDLKMFMNSQHPNTVVDFADIELICNDTLNRSMYSDENMELIDQLEELRISQQLAAENIILLSERIKRWKYAWQLWSGEYSGINKIFGGGFEYLELYGNKFYPDKNRIDYPHNPILSAFLYSGLIGGFFYLYFLVLSFKYYWRYRKHIELFFILFLITFVFVFISSDSHFNVPIFAVLSLVPFITRFMVKEKEQEKPA